MKKIKSERKCAMCKKMRHTSLFNTGRSSYCKRCHAVYWKDWKEARNFVPRTITKEELEKELKRYTPPTSGGLNALIDLEVQFERVYLQNSLTNK